MKYLTNNLQWNISLKPVNIPWKLVNFALKNYRINIYRLKGRLIAKDLQDFQESCY